MIRYLDPWGVHVRKEFHRESPSVCRAAIAETCRRSDSPGLCGSVSDAEMTLTLRSPCRKRFAGES